MQVTILHRYFWPQEYPYAQMLKDITESVNSLDHDVCIMTTASGSEKEHTSRQEWVKKNNIELRVLRLGSEKEHGIIRKLFNSLYYSAWVFSSLCLQRNDIVMVATTPPIIIAAIVRWASYLKKFKYVYHCQDIHPEAMLMNANIKRGLIYSLLLNMDFKNINQAWKVITLSEDMKQTYKKRGCRTDHINIINNYAFKIIESTLKKNKSPKIQFLFAGSLGRFQNLEMLMEALIHFRTNDDVEFIFFGDGVLRKKMEKIKQREQLDNVHLLGQKTVKEAVIAMNNADFGIVSISPGICEVAYPSKAIMYMGNGLPLFALVDEGSELSRFVTDNSIGITMAPSSVKNIVDGIEKAISIHNSSPILHNDVKSVASNCFGKTMTLNKIAKVFNV